MLWLGSCVFLLALLNQASMPVSGQVLSCPEGYIYLSSYCVPVATSCPKHYELHNGLCQPIPVEPTVIPCPYGQSLINGICTTALTTACQFTNCQILTCCSGVTNAVIIPCAMTYPPMSSTPSPIPCPSYPLPPSPWPTQTPGSLLPGSSHPGNNTPIESTSEASISGSTPGGLMPESSTSGSLLRSTSRPATSLLESLLPESLSPDISTTESSRQETTTTAGDSSSEIAFPNSSTPRPSSPEWTTPDSSTPATSYPGESQSSEAPNSGITVYTTSLPVTESPPIVTTPPSSDKTTPPPSELRLPCAPGTYDVNGACRPVYCKNGVYLGGKCIQVTCPVGTIWTGARCSRPQQSEITLKWSSTIKEQLSHEDDTILENVNNINVDAPINLQMGSSCGDNDKDCESMEQESEELNKCCLLLGPRICRCDANDGKWKCYSKRYRRCGAICRAATVILKPPPMPQQPENNTDIVVLPPELDFDCQSTQTCQDEVHNYYDCSGCAAGVKAHCSSYCYAYRCSSRSCAYYDQQAYCELYPGEVGCQAEDGCYANWCNNEH